MKVIYAVLAATVLACFGCKPTPSEPIEASVADVLAAVEASSPATETIAAPLFKPRPASGFVPANKDTRTPLQWAQDACQAATWSPDDPAKGWRCGTKVPKPTVFAASTGGTPTIPVSWTVPTWFVNKLTGNDGNACTTALTACATKQEIWVHRLGAQVGTCPRFQQTTIIEQDASDTDNTDPIYLCAASEKGSSFILKGGPATTTAATFTLAAAKNTAAGTNSLLTGSFSAGSPAANVLVTNTTAGKSSKAWIRKTAGGANWQISQPIAPVTIPSASLIGAEVNTWASTDTVTLSTPIAINVANAQDLIGDFDVAFDNAMYLYNATLFDPEGAGTNNLVIGAQVHVIECLTQRALNYQTFALTNVGAALISNTDEEVSLIVTASRSASNYSPFIAGGIVSGAQVTGSTGFFDDVILQHDAFLGSGFIFSGPIFISGNVFLGDPVTTSGNVVLQGAATVLYGESTNTINLTDSAHFWLNSGGTFVGTFTAPGLVTGIQLNGKTTVSCNTGADPGVIHNATTTPAHLDAACGAGTGLGSAAFVLGGASVANF